MTDIFDERRRGLEEEYFHKKNQEAIEKLRDKIAVSAAAKASGTSSMRCPRCDGNLKTSRFEDVDIDICDRCSGVWLDSGEFHHVTKHGQTWFARLLQSWNPE
jgi:uncharacterized protein